MSNLQIAALAYGVIAVVYLAPTYIEGERAGGRWSAYRIAGLGFCLFWPLLTVVFICKVTAGPSKPNFVFIDPVIPAQRGAAGRSPE